MSEGPKHRLSSLSLAALDIMGHEFSSAQFRTAQKDGENAVCSFLESFCDRIGKIGEDKGDKGGWKQILRLAPSLAISFAKLLLEGSALQPKTQHLAEKALGAFLTFSPVGEQILSALGLPTSLKQSSAERRAHEMLLLGLCCDIADSALRVRRKQALESGLCDVAVCVREAALRASIRMTDEEPSLATPEGLNLLLAMKPGGTEKSLYLKLEAIETNVLARVVPGHPAPVTEDDRKGLATAGVQAGDSPLGDGLRNLLRVIDRDCPKIHVPVRMIGEERGMTALRYTMNWRPKKLTVDGDKG